jgi:hypothetical protein
MRFPLRTPKRLSVILLGVWLIAQGVFALAPDLQFRGVSTLLAALAIAAGVLLLLER